jgi:tetratricopeptide (TPR) repeat protein
MEMLQIKGDVKIAKGTKHHRVFLGDAIDSIGELIFGKDGWAKVVCHDGSTAILNRGKSNVPESCKGRGNKATTSDTRSPTATEQSQIDADVKNLRQQPIDNDVKGIAIAYLYQSKGMYTEAIEELEKLVDGKSQTTAVYQLLGSIYQQRKIEKIAKARYQTGLNLAKKEGNVEAQKYIQEQLKVLNKTTN